jgi:hypothetical protein
MNITIIINMSIIIITMITIKHGPNFNTTTTIIIIIIIIITASNFSIANELFDFLHLGREHATRPRAILAYVNIWNGNIWEIINRKPNYTRIWVVRWEVTVGYRANAFVPP